MTQPTPQEEWEKECFGLHQSGQFYKTENIIDFIRTKIELAKKEERERIIKWIDKNVYTIDEKTKKLINSLTHDNSSEAIN